MYHQKNRTYSLIFALALSLSPCKMLTMHNETPKEVATANTITQKMARLSIQKTTNTDIPPTPTHATEIMCQTEPFTNATEELSCQTEPTPSPEKADISTQLDTPMAWTFFSGTTTAESLTEKALIGLINKETKSIRAALYEFNLYSVAYALCKAYARGVSVEIILDNKIKRSVAQLVVKRCGIPIKYLSPSGGILHTKMFIFESNQGVAQLNLLTEQTNYTELPSGECSIFWTGSTNIAGSATTKNMETATALFDKKSIESAYETFSSWWNAAEKEGETDRKLILLESIETKTTTDEKINKVPSTITIHLLKSQFYRDPSPETGYIGTNIQPNEILTYKEFTPKGEPTEGKPSLLCENFPVKHGSHIIAENGKAVAAFTETNNIVRFDTLQLSPAKIPQNLQLSIRKKPVTLNPKWFFKHKNDNQYYQVAILCGMIYSPETDMDSELFDGPYKQENVRVTRSDIGTRHDPDPNQKFSLKGLIGPCSSSAKVNNDVGWQPLETIVLLKAY